MSASYFTALSAGGGRGSQAERTRFAELRGRSTNWLYVRPEDGGGRTTGKGSYAAGLLCTVCFGAVCFSDIRVFK